MSTFMIQGTRTFLISSTWCIGCPHSSTWRREVYWNDCRLFDKDPHAKLYFLQKVVTFQDFWILNPAIHRANQKDDRNTWWYHFSPLDDDQYYCQEPYTKLWMPSSRVKGLTLSYLKNPCEQGLTEENMLKKLLARVEGTGEGRLPNTLDASWFTTVQLKRGIRGVSLKDLWNKRRKEALWVFVNKSEFCRVLLRYFARKTAECLHSMHVRNHTRPPTLTYPTDNPCPIRCIPVGSWRLIPDAAVVTRAVPAPATICATTLGLSVPTRPCHRREFY